MNTDNAYVLLVKKLGGVFMNIFWDNDVAGIVYDYAWLIFFVGIIIMIILGMKYFRSKKVLKADSTFEDDEKKKKIDELNKKYIFLVIVVIIISGICFGAVEITMSRILMHSFKPKVLTNVPSSNCSQSVGATVTDPLAYEFTFDKPIIYLYPEQETEVTVKLKNPEKLTCTYPKYKNSWNVIAKPNGDLIDLNTRRNLYALYWEGINTTKSNEEEGFVVKGEDTIAFLEEKLAILGLTEREANEFIMYWLPQMERNQYNFIRFETIEEINENMPLEIYPKPDSIIRVMMEWKPLAEEKKIETQGLVTPVREGFTVVEWGGSRIK